MVINYLYYKIKPIIPRWFQIIMRKYYVLWKRKKCINIWPIDERAKMPPKDWSGWPEGKYFSLVLTHDVETNKGLEKCMDLIDLELKLGFRSSFYFVPEKYNVPKELRQYLNQYGFEFGVHGLIHDGNLYRSREVFQERAVRINIYLKEWDAVGFRSPSMHHNLDWINELNIEYDASTFDTDPFEPQSDGMCTIFPFCVRSNTNQKGYVELPYTLPQDFSLFVLMGERNIDIWKKKLKWIAQYGGMVLLNTHPDYMNFDGKKLGIEEYPVEYYEEFLGYIKLKYEGQYWHVLPRELARFWSINCENW